MEDKVKQAVALAAALEKIETYIPTVYKNNSEPDLDEIHLNHAENGIARVTNALNGAIDVIKALQTGKIDTTKLVNNFLSTDPTAVAAAPTVKNLDARVTQLNGEIVIIQKVYRADQSGIIEILFETPFLHAQYHISVTQLFSETPYLYSVLYTSTAGFKIKVSDTSGNAKPNLDIALNVLAVIK